MKVPKVLGIGLPRTGTYSLAVALRQLGFTTKHYPQEIEDIAIYHACTEVRFPIKDILQFYPNSKLILTVRDKKKWIRSCNLHSKHLKENWNPFWKQKEDWISMYDKRIYEVEAYNDTLILDICAGQGWHELCSFLNKPMPSQKFPNVNKTSIFLL
jgi:hypothetical protein